jgi:DNA-binding response OmpR family regulator
VVLLDINLPGMTAFETSLRIRMFSDVPIVAMTVRDAEQDKVEALDA